MSSLEFRLAFDSALDDAAMPDPEVPDFLDKFRATAELAAVAGGFETAELFQRETANINAQHRTIYKRIAAAEAKAEKKSPAGDSLAKRASGITIEETVYPSGAVVVAELENGVCIRTYTKEVA
jgi:hypothetical protein